MRQQVINYQCDVIQKKVSNHQLNISLNDSHSYRYGTWRLQQTIQQFASKFDYTIKWIGCDAHAHALSFFYCMLIGSLQDQTSHDEVFIKFKYSLYQQSKQVLSILDQKIFIEHLGLIQDSKNIGQFLKKSSHLQSLFIKVFSMRCPSLSKKGLKNSGGVKLSKMEELQWFSAIFPFFKIVVIQLLINKIFSQFRRNNVFLCYNRPVTNCHHVSYLKYQIKRKKKTQVYGYGLQYMDSMKNFQLFQNKQQTSRDLDKYKKLNTLTNSQSKQLLSKIQQTKTTKQIKPVQISSVIHFYPKDETKNSTNEQKNNQRHSFTGKTQVKQVKHLLSSIQYKQKQIFHNYLRSTIKDQRNLKSTPKITSQRVSIQKQAQSKPKPQKGKQEKMISSIPIDTIAQICQKQRKCMPNSRQNFIFQSLNPHQNLLIKKQLSPKHDSRVPKFLSKINQQSLPYTFSEPPVKFSQAQIRHQPKKQKKQQVKQVRISSNYDNYPNIVTSASNIPTRQRTKRRES